MNNEKKIFPGASVAVAGLHLYGFLSPNLNFHACRSNLLKVTLSHRTIIEVWKPAQLIEKMDVVKFFGVLTQLYISHGSFHGCGVFFFPIF